MKAMQLKKIIDNWDGSLSSAHIEEVYNSLNRLEELEEKVKQLESLKPKYILKTDLSDLELKKGTECYINLGYWYAKSEDGDCPLLAHRTAIDPNLIEEIKPREAWAIIFVNEEIHLPIGELYPTQELAEQHRWGDQKIIKFVEVL